MIHSRLLQFSENAKLYKFSIFMDRLINDISYIFTDMLFRILIQLIRVDRLSIFKDNVGLSDLWKMSFKNLTGIIHGDRYNGTTGFGCDFKCSVFKREKRNFLYPQGRYR